MSLQDNLSKADQLQPQCQWAAKQWLTDCWNQNLLFTITAVYRTQAEQNRLYAQGRTTPGKIVTWTHTSLHTQRLAMDVVATNCTYEQIEAAGKVYGIYRPPDLVALGDIGHFQFDRCVLQPKPPQISPLEKLRGLVRRFNGEKDLDVKSLIKGAANGIAKRLGLPPPL